MDIFNVQRTKAPKVGNPELWFMCSAHCLMMLYIHVSFHETISNTFNLQSGHEYMVHVEIQSNFNGSNTFGIMTISSRQGLFEPLRVYNVL